MTTALTKMKVRRGGAPARDVTIRAEINATRGLKHLDRAFLRSLSSLHPDLELLWIPQIERWTLYKVIRKGDTADGDRMLKVFDLIGPNGEAREPGAWLIDKLRHLDIFRRFDAGPARAAKLYCDFLDDIDRKKAESAERERKNLSEEIGRDLYKCVKNKCTWNFSSPVAKTEKKESGE